MTTTSPAVIHSYFDASNRNDIDSLVACFAPDATVTDESATHRGSDEIRRWAIDVRKKYEFQAQVINSRQQPGRTIVTARVSGNFPGSPVNLDFQFSLDAEKIHSLSIIPSADS